MKNKCMVTVIIASLRSVVLCWSIFMVVVFLKTNGEWKLYWKVNKRCRWRFGCYTAAIIRAYTTEQNSILYNTKTGACKSPVSPVVANIYMEMFEELVLKTTPAPRIWKRYADDTFCVMEKEDTQTFLDHLNSLCPTIQFIMELEENGCLPFLDTLLEGEMAEST